MIIYSIIMFAATVLFFAFGIAIYKGNTKLIHDYHQTNLGESRRQEYGRAFAKGMFSMCAVFLISGIIALLGKNGSVMAASLIVLAVGLVVSVIILVKVQRKYNGGLF